MPPLLTVLIAIVIVAGCIGLLALPFLMASNGLNVWRDRIREKHAAGERMTVRDLWTPF